MVAGINFDQYKESNPKAIFTKSTLINAVQRFNLCVRSISELESIGI